MEHAFRAEGVDAAVSDGGRTAGAFVEPEIVSIGAVVIESP